MDEEEPQQPRPALNQLAREDLDSLSVEDLEDRLEQLQKEVTRVNEAIAAKRSRRHEAEKLFKN